MFFSLAARLVAYLVGVASITSALFRSKHDRRDLSYDFVTASDESHEKSLIRLLESIRVARPEARIFVVDLGLSVQVRETVANSPQVVVVDFPFSQAPEFFNMESKSGSYAWKPFSISLVIELCERTNSKLGGIIWLDAGCLLTSRIRIPEALTTGFGVFANSARGSVKDWTHQDTLSAFEKRNGKSLDHFALEQSQISAAFIGFNLDQSWVRALLKQWRELSMDQDIISPVSATKENHRFDQAVVSLLLETEYREVRRRVAWPQSLLGFKIHQDID